MKAIHSWIRRTVLIPWTGDKMHTKCWTSSRKYNCDALANVIILVIKSNCHWCWGSLCITSIRKMRSTPVQCVALSLEIHKSCIQNKLHQMCSTRIWQPSTNYQVHTFRLWRDLGWTGYTLKWKGVKWSSLEWMPIIVYSSHVKLGEDWSQGSFLSSPPPPPPFRCWQLHWTM